MGDVVLRYAAGGRTVILSSHLLGEVEQTCTHVVVMHEGRRLAAGPVAEIMGEAGALMVGTPEAEHAVAVLRAMDGVEGAEPHPDGGLAQRDGVPPSAVVAALVAAGVPVDRVGPSRRLEDAFLALISAPGNGAGRARRRPGPAARQRSGRQPGRYAMTAGVSPAGPGPGMPAGPVPGTPAAGGPALDAPAAPGYDPRRTLPLRVGFIRPPRRRRPLGAF